MIYRLHTFAIVLCFAALVAGCGGNSGSPTAADGAPPAAAAPKAAPALYSLEVRSEGEAKEVSLSDDADVTLGGNRVQVEKGAISVNGKKYGKLAVGDKVLIEKDGQVMVNAEVREPW